MTNRAGQLKQLFPILILIALWEITARFDLFSTGNLLPPFTRVIAEGYALVENGLMARSLSSTLLRILVGLAAGLTAGIIVGAMVGWKTVVHRSLSPIISLLYPIPALGWIPLLMIWMGINELLPMAVIAISCFFPVCYNTTAGIRHVDPEIVAAARILGASDLRILLTVIFPLAAPHIFVGLRLSSGMAWRAVIAAEMVAIPTGIGALLMRAESLVRVDIIMACLAVLSVMCLLFEKLFAWMEKSAVGKWTRHA